LFCFSASYVYRPNGPSLSGVLAQKFVKEGYYVVLQVFFFRSEIFCLQKYLQCVNGIQLCLLYPVKYIIKCVLAGYWGSCPLIKYNCVSSGCVKKYSKLIGFNPLNLFSLC